MKTSKPNIPSRVSEHLDIEDMVINRLDLDVDTVVSRRMYDPQYIADADYQVREWSDKLTGQMIRQIKRVVLSHRESMDVTYELRLPKTWFDHVKLRWWPRLWTSRWQPILERVGLRRMCEVQWMPIPVTQRIHFKATYPTLQVVPRGPKHSVYISTDV